MQLELLKHNFRQVALGNVPYHFLASYYVMYQYRQARRLDVGVPGAA